MTVLMSLLMLIPTAAIAAEEPPGVCDLQPGLPICQGGGTDPGDSGETEGDMAWGTLDPVTSICPGDPPRPQYLQRLVWTTGPNFGSHVHVSDFGGTFGPGDPVPGGPTGAVFAADGYVYRWVCTDPSVGDDVWEEAVEQMTPIDVDVSPTVTGLTGLETWVWYDGQVTVDPFQVAWTDPATGVGWILEARAWVAEHRWDLGDDTTITATATVFGDARGAAGTETDPAGTHTYRTTSAGAGHTDGYPFTYDATWVGDYRWWSTAADAWSVWVPMANTFTDTTTLSYEVIQIRSIVGQP